jgi:HAD superfamily hydrolase (TIGR01509 family)
VRAVFFDAGGTLVHLDHTRIAATMTKVLGRPFAGDALAAAEYDGRAAVEALMDGKGTGSDTDRWAVHFRAMLGALGVTDAEFAAVGPAIRAEHVAHHLWSVVTPGTAEALESLGRSGWFVACISNADGHVAQRLEAEGLLRHLRFVVDSGAVGMEKPDPRIFELALRQADVRAEDAYYVGDVYPVDIVGAQGVGMVPVLLDPLARYGGRGCRTARDVPSFCRELVPLRDAA